MLGLSSNMPEVIYFADYISLLPASWISFFVDVFLYNTLAQNVNDNIFVMV